MAQSRSRTGAARGPSSAAGIMSEVAAGAIQSLLVVLALGAIEKARTLRARAASWHPVLLGSSFRRRHATALVSLSLIGDICAIILGLLRPGLGLGFAGLLVILYTVAAATRPGALYRHSHCGCLGGLLDGQGLSCRGMADHGVVGRSRLTRRRSSESSWPQAQRVVVAVDRRPTRPFLVSQTIQAVVPVEGSPHADLVVVHADAHPMSRFEQPAAANSTPRSVSL